MRWISHEIVTGIFVCSLTGGNTLCAAAALAGSLLPDVIEGRAPLDAKGLARWARSHRMISHWFVPYSLAALGAFLRGLFRDHAAVTMENTILALTTGRDGGTLFFIAGFFFVGALFHIGVDSLCGTVPSLNPKKRIGVRLFPLRGLNEGASYYRRPHGRVRYHLSQRSHMVKLIALLCILIAPSLCYSFCFEEAGAEYGVSPHLLWAIAKVESGFNPAARNTNANGSIDYGVMQINSGWYSTLGRERWLHLNDACYNVRTGAWILSQCVQRHGYTWEAVGCYNAKSRNKGARYANRVYQALVEAGAISEASYKKRGRPGGRVE